ncbi:MAG: hypothetical protein KF774_20175 [Planctomyces sp.]|nr:hypothetical protein [Planctomyces sp.]
MSDRFSIFLTCAIAACCGAIPGLASREGRAATPAERCDEGVARVRSQPAPGSGPGSVAGPAVNRNAAAPLPSRVDELPASQQPRNLLTAERAAREASNATASLPPLPGARSEPQRSQPGPSSAVPGTAGWPGHSETSQRIERLQRQLDLLQRRFLEPEPELDPVVEPITPIPDEEPPFESEIESPGPAPIHDPPPPAASIAAEPSPKGPPPNRLIRDLPVLPADRIAVADNLFAARETVLAAEIYQQVPLKDLSRTDAAWVSYQLANCDRRLGRIDDARKRYRRLVSDPSIGWIQDLSKWWLHAIDEQESLKKELVQLTEVLKAASPQNPKVASGSSTP